MQASVVNNVNMQCYSATGYTLYNTEYIIGVLVNGQCYSLYANDNYSRLIKTIMG